MCVYVSCMCVYVYVCQPALGVPSIYPRPSATTAVMTNLIKLSRLLMIASAAFSLTQSALSLHRRTTCKQTSLTFFVSLARRHFFSSAKRRATASSMPFSAARATDSGMIAFQRGSERFKEEIKEEIKKEVSKVGTDRQTGRHGSMRSYAYLQLGREVLLRLERAHFQLNCAEGDYSELRESVRPDYPLAEPKWWREVQRGPDRSPHTASFERTREMLWNSPIEVCVTRSLFPVPCFGSPSF
jgi:hypothetical protein